ALSRLSFFFNDTATTEIYTLSLHDALPIYLGPHFHVSTRSGRNARAVEWSRSEEHTSELQSHLNLVCRLLLEKKEKHTEKSREHRGAPGAGGSQTPPRRRAPPLSRNRGARHHVHRST